MPRIQPWLNVSLKKFNVSWGRKVELKESGFLLTLDHTTKSSHQTILYWHDIDIKKNIHTPKYVSMEQGRKPRNISMHLWFDTGGKNIQWRKDSLFNRCYWGNWTASCKRIKLHYAVTPCTKINSKLIKNLKAPKPSNL